MLRRKTAERFGCESGLSLLNQILMRVLQPLEELPDSPATDTRKIAGRFLQQNGATEQRSIRRHSRHR